jgi:hypothetical protein
MKELMTYDASSIRQKGQKTVALPQWLKDEQEAAMDAVEVKEDTTVKEAKETKVSRTMPR